MLQFFNKFFVGVVKYIIYVLFIIIITVFNKWDVEKIYQIFIYMFIISLFFIFVILLNTIFINKVIFFNKFVFNKLPFFIKLRREFNFALLMRIFLSLFIFIDKFLIKVLFLHTRYKTFFYFFRLLLYYNILIILTLPFFLFTELYTLLLFFFERPTALRDYIYKRIDFILITIFVALLFNIKWISIIICIWIFEQIFLTYYYWIKSFLIIKVNSIFNWKQTCIALRLAFNNNGMSYNTIARNLKQMSEYRYKVILFYKGLVFDNKGNLNEQFVKTRFVFMKTLYELYVNHFWNNYYTRFQMMKNAAWEYYDSSNDEEFILRYLNNYIVGLGMDKEGFKKYFNENSLLNILLQNDLNDKFYANVYIILYNVLLNFKNDLTLIDDFFFLRVKYDLRLHYDYTNNSDVKQFFDKLYLINSKIDK